MGKWLQKLLLFSYFFLMIYKPEFIFFYPSVNTFFGLVGLCFYFMNFTSKKVLIYEKGFGVKPVLQTYYPVLVFCVLSIIVNMSSDLHYVRYFISLVLFYFMAYLGAWGFYKVYGEITPKKVTDFFIAAALLHLGVSLARFAVPSVNDFITSLIRMSEADKLGMEHTAGGRLQGFGAAFFTSGIINGFILIMIAFTYYTEKLSSLTRIIYLVSFVVIFVIGLMNARTIMIGGGIGAVILFLAFLKGGGINVLKSIVMVGVAAIVLFWSSSKVLTTSDIDFELLSDFGFELFRAMESGEGTRTTDIMISQYSILPDNPKTWIIGDARWTGDKGWDYYGGTDIGFGRNLFYFGIIGSILLYLYNYNILKITFRRRNFFGKTTKYVVAVLFIYTLILNAKGPADLYFYVLPYYFCMRKGPHFNLITR